MNVLPGIKVQWQESAEPLISFLRYTVYRRELGETTWTLRKNIADRAITVFDDYEVSAGVVYEYALTQWSDSSGDDVESDLSDIVQQSNTWEHLFIHDRLNPSFYTELFVSQQRTVAPQQDVSFLRPWNHRDPIAHVGKMRTETYTATLTGQWDHTQDNLSKEQYRALKTLIERQDDYGSTLVARQASDIFMFCVVDAGGLERTDQGRTFTQSIRLRKVNVES